VDTIRQLSDLILNGGLLSAWPLWLTMLGLLFVATVLGSYLPKELG